MCPPAEMRHACSLARTLSSGHQLTTRPSGLRSNSHIHPRAVPLAPLRAAVTATAFPPQRLGYSQHHPYHPWYGKATESRYLNDPAGGRHLAAHHDPREGAASGALASLRDNSSGRLGAGPARDVTEAGQAGSTSTVKLAPPLCSSPRPSPPTT